MIVVQRVRVRWGADARGSTRANLRNAIPETYALPQMPTDEGCVVHEILADDAVGYQPTVQTSCGVDALRAAGLHIESTDNGMVVERLPGSDVYPASRRTSRLFTLKPGEIGRYRANFRFRFTTLRLRAPLVLRSLDSARGVRAAAARLVPRHGGRP